MSERCIGCHREFEAGDFAAHAVHHADRACEMTFFNTILSLFIGLPSERGRNYDPAVLCVSCVAKKKRDAQAR